MSLTADRRAPRHRLGRGQARVERRHVRGAGLERIAGRDQPPHLVEPKRVERGEADPAVAAVGRVEDPPRRPMRAMRAMG